MVLDAGGGGGGGGVAPKPDNWGAPDPSSGSQASDAEYFPADGEMGQIEGNPALYYQDIKVHYPAVMSEDSESIGTSVQAWKSVSNSLSTAANTVRRHGRTLEGQWDSPQAKQAFLMKVGMLAASMDDWAEKASENATALESLRMVVYDKREEMKNLWAEFEKEAERLDEEESEWYDVRDWGRDIKEAARGQHRNAENLEKYSQRSRDEILTPLQSAYDSAFWATNKGSAFQGLTDSVQAGTPKFGTPGAPAGPSAPGAPGAPAAPAAPAAPGAPPQAPGSLDRQAMIGVAPMAPNMPPAPKLPPAQPDALRAWMQNQAPQNPGHEQALRDVQAHLERQAPEAPGAAPSPAFLPPPAAPGVLGARGAAPQAPGGMGNSSAAAAKGAAPAAPNVARGAAPTAPGLPGGAGGGAPAAPPRAPGVPGGLGGRGAPPKAPAGMGRGGAPVSPGLGGRGGPQAPAAPSRSGLGSGAPTLGGRNGRPGAPGTPKGLAGGPGGPGSGTRGMPNSLQGRPGAPGGARPGAPGGTGRTGRPAAPKLELGTGAKGATSLGGRTTPAARQANVEAARGALRKSLSGRPNAGVPSAARPTGKSPMRTTDRLRAQAKTAASTAPAKRQRDRAEDEERLAEMSLVGGTELFEAEQRGDGVVAARGPQGPVRRGGPAIGAKRD